MGRKRDMKTVKKLLIAMSMCMVLALCIPSLIPDAFGSITAEAATKVKINKKKATEIKEIFDRNKIISLNDLEMFMRFFEELQYVIEQKGLSKEITFDMFSFYALEAKPLLENCTEDYKKENWKRFRTFVEDMECIKKERNKN